VRNLLPTIYLFYLLLFSFTSDFPELCASPKCDAINSNHEQSLQHGVKHFLAREEDNSIDASLPAKKHRKPRGSFRTPKLSSTKSLPRSSKEIIPPPPLSESDPRRLYGRILLNTLNSCDMLKVRDFFTRYLTEDVISDRCYEGEHNPNGRMFYHIAGRNSLIQFYDVLFKASPDLFYTIGESSASFTAGWKVVISTSFDLKFTRIADMRILKNPEVVGESFTTGRSDTSHSCMGDSGREGLDESLFHGFSEKVTISSADKIYISRSSVANSVRIHTRGTIHLTLNEKGKITAFDVRFCAVDDAVKEDGNV
jgi:hypothetical protein